MDLNPWLMIKIHDSVFTNHGLKFMIAFSLTMDLNPWLVMLIHGQDLNPWLMI
jgi:hypothetical protein